MTFEIRLLNDKGAPVLVQFVHVSENMKGLPVFMWESGFSGGIVSEDKSLLLSAFSLATTVTPFIQRVPIGMIEPEQEPA